MSKLNKIVNQIKVAIQKGDLRDKIVCWFLIKLGYSNGDLQALEIRNKKYLYIKKHYSGIIKKYQKMPKSTKERTKNVWILWLQGIDFAPDIVKSCINSIEKFKGDYQIVILERKNFKSYVDLPDYIYEKWEKGIISDTHFSDIIRTDLMVRYGGIWLDATVYLTASLPEYILNTDFFLFKRSVGRDRTIIANSWLISSNKNTRLMLCVRELLFAYWKHETKIRDYFLWHIMATIAIEQFPKDWEDVLFVPDVLPEMMRWNIFKSINGGEYQNIINHYSIHKLSYKIDLPGDTKDTIYDFILSKKGDIR